MANNRIFYAVQALKIGSVWMQGVQSVGITTNFNLEQVFEMGQLGIYENIQNLPEVEVTAEKVLDGRSLLFTAAGGGAGKDIVSATSGTVDVRLAIYSDTNTSASGATADYAVVCTGMRVSAVSYTFPVEGNATESITLVGNSKLWDTTGGATFPPITGTLEAPNTTVFRRQHFSATTPSTLPSEVSGYKIQSVSASADIGRENIFELGSFAPYTKYVTFPVTTTCDIEVISTEGDQVDASASDPVYSAAGDRTIILRADNGTSTIAIDLGTKNRLTSVNYTGADTGGGNATSTYSYQGFNYFQVSTA